MIFQASLVKKGRNDRFFFAGIELIPCISCPAEIHHKISKNNDKHKHHSAIANAVFPMEKNFYLEKSEQFQFQRVAPIFKISMNFYRTLSLLLNVRLNSASSFFLFCVYTLK